MGKNKFDLLVKEDVAATISKLKSRCKKNEIAYFGPLPSYRQRGNRLILKYNVMIQHPGKRQLYLTFTQTENGTHIKGSFRLSLFSCAVTMVFGVFMLFALQPWRTDNIYRMIAALAIAFLYTLMLLSGKWLFREKEQSLLDYVKATLAA